MKGWRETFRQNKILKWFLLFSSWFFQGIMNSDTTEKYYKIFFTIFFSGIFYYFLGIEVWPIRLLIAFTCGHTINWLVNGPIAAIFIHRLFIGKAKKEKVFKYLNNLESRLTSKDEIYYCAVYGSIARGALKDSSDIDVGFLRKPGFKNAILGLYFITKERILTNLKGIPFEGYLFDSLDNMIARFKNENTPVVIKQKGLIDNSNFPVGISLEQARIINKL